MTAKRTAVAMAIGLASLFCVSITQQPAFAAAGSLDPTFGTGGEVLTNLGAGPGGAAIEPLPSNAVLQSNGDIVVSGGFGLVRYLPDGSREEPFRPPVTRRHPPSRHGMAGAAAGFSPP
jgi:hypothetical protein